ncbi:MAG: hypothetical protein SNJ63_00765 [Sphingomonadaceae bacterium]
MTDRASERAQRLRAALRANLRRRKGQARDLGAAGGMEATSEGETAWEEPQARRTPPHTTG